MTRRVCLALAVVAGLAAAILLASGPTVHYDGKTATCPGVIASAEGGGIVDPGRGPAYKRACDDKQRDWSVLAGLAVLVSVAAGSAGYFRGRDREPVAARGGV